MEATISKIPKRRGRPPNNPPEVEQKDQFTPITQNNQATIDALALSITNNDTMESGNETATSQKDSGDNDSSKRNSNDSNNCDEFKVAQGFDKTFFKNKNEMLTARQMVNEHDRDKDSDDDDDTDTPIQVPSNGFLWGLLISLDAPSLDKKKSSSTRKASRIKNSRPYHRVISGP